MTALSTQHEGGKPNVKSFSKNRLVALGATGALALGTVVSVGAIAAPANAADTQYTCTTTGGALTFPVSVSNPFPASAVVGQSVPAQDVAMDVSIAQPVVDLIKLLLAGAGLPTTAVSGNIEDAAMVVGGQSVPLEDLKAPVTAIPSSGGMTLPVVGATSPFTPTQTGSLPIGLPDTFTFVPGGLTAFAMPCELTGATSTLGFLNVSGSDSVEKAASTTTAKLKNAPVTKSEHAKIRVKVRTGGEAASGKVIAKEGKKVLKKATLNDNDNGNKTLRLPLLSKGIHKIVIKYKGNDTTKSSRDVVKFKVRRG
jgi:hypothetical protein